MGRCRCWHTISEYNVAALDAVVQYLFVVHKLNGLQNTKQYQHGILLIPWELGAALCQVFVVHLKMNVKHMNDMLDIHII